MNNSFVKVPHGHREADTQTLGHIPRARSVLMVSTTFRDWNSVQEIETVQESYLPLFLGTNKYVVSTSNPGQQKQVALRSSVKRMRHRIPTFWSHYFVCQAWDCPSVQLGKDSKTMCWNELSSCKSMQLLLLKVSSMDLLHQHHRELVRKTGARAPLQTYQIRICVLTRPTNVCVHLKV